MIFPKLLFSAGTRKVNVSVQYERPTHQTDEKRRIFVNNTMQYKMYFIM